jgi:hypothetical protein
VSDDLAEALRLVLSWRTGAMKSSVDVSWVSAEYCEKTGVLVTLY